MFEQPGEGDGFAGDVAFVSHAVQDAQHSRGIIVHLPGQQVFAALTEKPAAEGAPRQRGDSFFLTLIEGAVFEALNLQKAHLDLVHAERERERGLKEGELGGTEVAHAELAHFAGLAEGIQSAGHLVGVHQVVGAMEVVQIDAIDAEPAEGGVALSKDVVAGKVVSGGGTRGLVLRTDSAFGGDEEAVPEAWVLAEQAAEKFFAASGAVDVGVVKQGEAGLESGEDGGLGGGVIGGVIALGGQPPATISESGGAQGGWAEEDSFHGAMDADGGGLRRGEIGLEKWRLLGGRLGDKEAPLNRVPSMKKNAFFSRVCLVGLGVFSGMGDGLRAAEQKGDGHQLEVAKLGVPKVAEASDEGQNAIKQFKVGEGLSMSLWAAEPLLANPVAFATDSKGRWYVAETFRLHAGVSDIRGHMEWLEAELASTSLESWLAILKGDPKLDLKATDPNSERVQRLEDTKGSGKADRSTVFADGLNGPLSGIAAGILAWRDQVYLTNIPSLWRFEDRKGSGVADVRQELATGFGVRTAFLGHDLHGLCLGPDGRVYFTVGDRGANAKAHDGSHVYNPETGAVYRCNPDGTELEIFARGLRNPQELAFDKFGNLFTGDNNSDGGDPARFVYVVQGGDSGWRIGWQFLKEPPRGPWLSERMCYPAFEGQPAHHVPPVANIANGPSGLTVHPGTGLRAGEWRDRFFLADFRGSASNSGIHSFELKPAGAGFELVNPDKPVWNILATDVEFGVDGGLYLLDWVNGWGMTGKGRIYRVGSAGSDEAPEAKETRLLLAAGMREKTAADLKRWMAHADRRVRLEAQFELAARGQRAVLREIAQKDESQLARLHAIWGLGQVARKAEGVSTDLIPLLDDGDSEVRAQAAKTLGDLREKAAGAGLQKLLRDPSPRVRGFAAIGLSRVGLREAEAGLIEVLRENDDRDAVLRYAAVSGLAACSVPERLVGLAKDSSRAVRVGALNALRRSGNPKVAEFLKDTDPKVVAEAARAICDESIEGAMGALADLSGRWGEIAAWPVGTKEEPGPRDGVLRRVLNASFRLGGEAQARAVAALASNRDVPESIRVEALRRLGEWGTPGNVDRLMGLYRPLKDREAGMALKALEAQLPGLFAGQKPGGKAVRLAALEAVNQFAAPSGGFDFGAVVKDAAEDPAVRSEALRALVMGGGPGVAEVVSASAEDASEVVRKQAMKLLVTLKMPGVVPTLAKVLEKGTVGEKQSVLATLGGMREAEAGAVLERQMDELLAGRLAAELQLDVLEAAAKHGGEALKSRVARYEAGLDSKDPLAAFRVALKGGDAELGRRVFLEKAEASCVRCHKVKQYGAEVGPVLDGVGQRQTREYLLESIVDPNAKIAQGFETVIVTLKDGSVHAGILKKETAEELVLQPPVGAAENLKASDVAKKDKGMSGMPPLGMVLSKRDLRDVVEFLSRLR